MFDKQTQTILVVDDDKATRQLLYEILSDYKVLVAKNGNEALDMAKDNKYMPDLILLDVIMPGIKGYDVCLKLKTDLKTQNIPILFLTKADNPKLEAHGLEIGAVDYIKKPIYADILLGRVKTHLELKSYRDDLQNQVNLHKAKVEELNIEIIETQEEVIFNLGDAVEMRSKETANHVQRVSKYTYLLARKIGLKEEEARILELASPLHDVGKIGIPDSILTKPGELEPEERKEIEQHAGLGYKILRARKSKKTRILKTAAIIAHQHHERWDGKGYPQGLKGEDIHLYGRIAAIADVFDALATERCYKPAWARKRIITEFDLQHGKQFEPNLTDLFLSSVDEFYEILRNNPA